MWSVFLFARKRLYVALAIAIFVCIALLGCGAPCYAAEGHASFASLLAGGLSPVGLGGYHSTPARFANPSYGVSYYWMDDIEESSWNLSLEFGSDAYRVGVFVAYLSMDSVYRNLYSEFSFARPWSRFVFGASYGLDMGWIPGGVIWTRHRYKVAFDFKWREIHLAGMLRGFMDESVSPIVGVHWISDEAIAAFADCDFDYLYIGASFRWKFMEISTSYRFPDFAVALQMSFSGGPFEASYARGFKHNSIAWNGVHVMRRLKDEWSKIN